MLLCIPMEEHATEEETKSQWICCYFIDSTWVSPIQTMVKFCFESPISPYFILQIFLDAF